MAPFNTFYKKNYTTEDYQECMAWFQQRMDKLPPSLHFGTAHIPNLPYTVARIFTVFQRQTNQKGTYNGLFANLLKIRQILQEKGIE